MKANTEQKEPFPSRTNSWRSALIGGLAIASSGLFVGCASMSETDGAEAEPVQAEATQAETTVSTTVETKVDKATEEKVATKTAEVKEQVAEVNEAAQVAQEPAQTKGAEKADAMMASLAQKDKFTLDAEAAEPVATAEKATEQVDGKTAQKAEKVAATVAVEKAAPAPKPKKLTKSALKAGTKDLPITIELWTLRKNTSASGLILTTPTWQMGDGDYLSQIWLTLTDEALFVNSSSDIDAEVPGSGVKVNGGSLIPYDRIEGGNVAVLEGDWMGKLSDGGTIELMMGFFPDKAKQSPLFKSEGSLDALTRLVPTYAKLK